jgi:hypothetical protein
MLAMVVNDIAGCLDARSALAFFASMLAPTGLRCNVIAVNTPTPCRSEHARDGRQR